MHKWPGSAVSPRGHQPFSAISQNAFWSMDLRNGPESCFCLTNPTIIWEKGNLGPLGLAGTSLLLGRMQEVGFPFWLPRAQKTAKTARFGPWTGKTELMAAKPPKFRSFYPFESSGLINNWPATTHFSPKIGFHPPTSSCSLGWWYKVAISM